MAMLKLFSYYKYGKENLIDYQFIQKLIDVHAGVRRRNREDYVLHCIRVGEIVHHLTNDVNLQKLAMLHDVLEVCPNVSHKTLVHDFGLTQDELNIIDILTAHEGESSQDHFQRVLDSQNTKALLIKYCDCKDNAVFLLEDYE